MVARGTTHLTTLITSTFQIFLTINNVVVISLVVLSIPTVLPVYMAKVLSITQLQPRLVILTTIITLLTATFSAESADFCLVMVSPLLSHTALVILRAGFFLGCRRYVHRSLLTDLRQVIRDDYAEPVEDTLTPNHSDDESAPAGLTNRLNTDSLKPDSLRPRAPKKVLPAPSPGPAPSSALSASFTTFLFCSSFSEGSLLFSIVILGSWLEPTARRLNWNLSLGVLIASVVYVFPLAECFLIALSVLSRRTTERPRLLSARAIGLTLLPFAGYLFLYYRVGQTIQGLLGVENGSHFIGFLNTTLARICVPGVLLIASLSGGAAVNTDWENWEWPRQEKEPSITEQHITSSEQAQHRTRLDLQARRTAVAQTAALAGDPSGPSSSGIMNLLTGRRSSQLQLELSGVEALEQMTIDLASTKQRKAYAEYSRTIPGIRPNWATLETLSRKPCLRRFSRLDTLLRL